MTAGKFFKWLFIAGFLSCGCCGLGLSVCATAFTNEDWVAPQGGEKGVVDLGTAAFPDGTTSPVKQYEWRPSWSASPHRVRYVLASAEARDLEDAFQRFVRRNARNCTELECAYDFIFRSNEDAVDALAERFAERMRAAGLHQDEAAQLIITFVQEIPYEVPKGEPFEVLPAALVASEGRGDCDSKSLLAIMLLKKLGIPAAMLISLQLQHAAVGVGLPGEGIAFRRGSVRYRYAEVTATGWPIGQMPPEWKQPRLWSVLPLGD